VQAEHSEIVLSKFDFFFQISTEFQRLTHVNLEPKFMSMLDQFTPKLLSIFQVKKGAAGERHRAQMNTLLQVFHAGP